MMAMTYGHERSVERKIRFWIVRQERNQRKDGRQDRFKSYGDTPAVRRPRTADMRQR